MCEVLAALIDMKMPVASHFLMSKYVFYLDLFFLFLGRVEKLVGKLC